MRLVLCCLLALVGSGLCYKSYAGYQVIRTAALDETSLKMITPLMKNTALDFWTEPRVGRAVDIMTSPENADAVKSILKFMGLKPTVLVSDLETVVQNERAQIEASKRNQKREGRAPPFDRFLEWFEIEAYLDEVVATYPQIASLQTIGNSYEGRPLRVLKLSNGGTKPAIYLEASAHAREWIGPPAVLYAINELTENLANNQAILDGADFYFLVITNPDGYIFTWSDDRFWRKTRNINSGACIGTDPNRNYDYAWGGAGDGECSETYPGPAPFSAPETQAVSNFITANPQITCFVDVHSYGQYLLTPWGDTSALPPTYSQLETVGQQALAALASVANTQYTFGSTYNVLYSAYGLAEDWAYAKLGVPLVYVIELPEGGFGGFNPPPSVILPVATETWEAFKVFASNLPTERFPVKK